MFPRHLLIISAIVIFIAIASASPIEKPKLDDEIEGRHPAAVLAVGMIRVAVQWAATHCINEAADRCGNQWKNPKALVECAKNFLQHNKGRCALG